MCVWACVDGQTDGEGGKEGGRRRERERETIDILEEASREHTLAFLFVCTCFASGSMSKCDRKQMP